MSIEKMVELVYIIIRIFVSICKQKFSCKKKTIRLNSWSKNFRPQFQIVLIDGLPPKMSYWMVFGQIDLLDGRLTDLSVEIISSKSSANHYDFSISILNLTNHFDFCFDLLEKIIRYILSNTLQFLLSNWLQQWLRYRRALELSPNTINIAHRDYY